MKSLAPTLWKVPTSGGQTVNLIKLNDSNSGMKWLFSSVGPALVWRLVRHQDGAVHCHWARCVLWCTKESVSKVMMRKKLWFLAVSSPCNLHWRNSMLLYQACLWVRSSHLTFESMAVLFYGLFFLSALFLYFNCSSSELNSSLFHHFLPLVWVFSGAELA